MAEQNDVAKLYGEFEEALVDVLTTEGGPGGLGRELSQDFGAV